MSQKRVIIMCIHIVQIFWSVWFWIFLYMEYGYTSKDKYIHCWQALMYNPFSQRDDDISWCFIKHFAKSKVEKSR